MTELSFRIRPSLTKLLLRVCSFVGLGFILFSVFEEILALLVCVTVLVVSYVIRHRYYPQSFAYIEEHLWVIEYTNGDHIFAELVKYHRYGYAMILTFKTQKDDKLVNIWLFKDQFDLNVWKTLQKLSKLHI